ncbi:MAG TPA: DUF5615 family PIN-like protein [Blastocatellia bacterium]|nr:DUF5615 family PIN-like protein [Blastocatellia bacterium]
MKILFDHCVAKPLKKEFPHHEIKTVREMGWQALKNGELLDQAQEAGFEVLLTVDQNLRYQQNLQGRSIAVVVMVAGGITLEDLRPLVPVVERTLVNVQPGQVYEVKGEQ